MNHSLRIHRLTVTALLLTLIGCGANNGTTAANLDGGPTSLKLDMTLASSTSAATKKNDDGSFTPNGTTLTLTAAAINIDRFELYLPEGLTCSQANFIDNDVPGINVRCEEEIENDDGGPQVEAKIKIDGPFNYDLISGVSTPDIGSITVPSGEYRRLKIKTKKDANDVTLSASGTMLDTNNVSQPFSLALGFTETIDLKKCFQLVEGKLNRFTVALNVEQWFTGVDLNNCDSDDCHNLENDIRDNIENSFGVDTDSNDDGHNDQCSSETHHSSDDNGDNSSDDDDGTPDQGHGDN